VQLSRRIRPSVLGRLARLDTHGVRVRAPPPAPPNPLTDLTFRNGTIPGPRWVRARLARASARASSNRSASASSSLGHSGGQATDPAAYLIAAANPQAANPAVTGSLPGKTLRRAVLLSDDATAVYLDLDGANL
jgi:hypothetical protein